jgi:RNA polymerase sigma factor (sigma-70 family)
MDMNWELERDEEMEEIARVRMHLATLQQEDKLDSSCTFEEIFPPEGGDESIQDPSSFPSSCEGLRALLARDKLAGFERLIAQYGRLFHQIAYSVLYNYDLAQDAVSEAYIKMYDYWLKDAQPSEIVAINLLPYLCRIVLNASLTYLDKEKTQRLRWKKKEQELLIDQRRRFETPDEVLERKEEMQILHEEIDQLPAKYRRAIYLRYLLGEDMYGSVSEVESERYAQLASFTGINAATLRSHVSRGKIMLKNQLNTRGIYH